jgi:Ca-activated chloride channel homolog
MIFAHPFILFLLIPLAVLMILAWRRAVPAVRMSTAKPFKEANAGRLRGVSKIPFIFFSAALALLIVALARPRAGEETMVSKAKGIDIILAIDLSGSMQAIDVPRHITTYDQLYKGVKEEKVQNRLEVAKKEIASFINRRPNDRIGLIGFANLPYCVSPPTLDHGWLLANLKRLEPGIIGDATGIASPIASALHRLEKSDSKRKVLVLFTDGSNNVDARVSPRQAAKLAKSCNVVIYTVGIGSGNACILQDTPMGPRFVALRGEFDEPLLKDIADSSNGKYYRAFDSKGMREVMLTIDKMEKTSMKAPKYMRWTEYAPMIMSIALVLLVLGFIINHTSRLSLP